MPPDVGVHAQARWRRFLRANRAMIGDLTFEGVLTRMLESACELVGSPYGAIGILGPGGHGLAQFIHVGMGEEDEARIGHLPEGKGVLGALIDDPVPLRLDDLAADPRSVGLPEGHPPMRAFLGVPVLVGEEVFGNLYLASPDEGAFDEEDEHLVVALAATAGVAIENARLYEEAHHRQAWLEASNEMTRMVLTHSGEEALRTVAERVAELAEVDLVAVALPGRDPTVLQVEVAVGPTAEDLTDFSYALPGTISERVLASGVSEVFEDVATLHPPSPPLMVAEVVPMGPVMVIPLSGLEHVRGVLVVGRSPGSRVFAASEVDMATNFAYHAAVALELADARRESQRMALLEDRARIARDLHDHVIQQLFAAGMTLQATLPTLRDGPALQSVDRVVDIIDDAIRQIRSSIFQLRPRTMLGEISLRSTVLDVVSEAIPLLGWEATALFSGAVDSVADDELTGDVAAVVRESLSNVARHAHAERASVAVTAQGDLLEVVIEDDGQGMGATTRSSGLDNLARRAEDRGGSLKVRSGDEGGTRVTWRVPLPR